MKRPPAEPTTPRRDPYRVWTFRIAAAIVITVPLIYATATDAFRLPKLLLFEAGCIILAALLAISWVMGRPVLERRPITDPTRLWPVLILLWTIITTLTSTHRLLSIESLMWVSCSLVLFLATEAVARDHGTVAVELMYVPAAINAGLYCLQEFGIWNPFARMLHELKDHARNVALMGNPGDLGVYLIAPALAALAMTFSGGPRRALSACAAIYFGVVIALSLSVTAVGAYAFGAMVFAVIHLRQRVLVPAAAGGAILILLLVFFPPARNRVITAHGYWEAGDYDSLLTGRLPPFIAAIDMFKDHPIVGTGPGTYGFHYWPYKLRAEERYPRLLDSPIRNINAIEAHNDHLQTLSTTGIPGYLIFLGVLFSLAKLSWPAVRGQVSEEPRKRFAELFALPFVASFAVLALAQFPLEIAAVISSYLYLTALATSWGRS